MAKAFPTFVSGQPARPAKTSSDSNQVTTAGEVIAVTSGQLTLGALFGSIRVPKGAEILHVQLDATDLDTNGSPTITLEIGDAADPDRLLVANTIAQSGAAPVGPTIAKTGFGYQYTDETLISVRVAAAAATGAAGTIKYAVTYVSQ